jgi:predicted TIM-barrel fold metal-dependent hydrolase
MNSLSRRDILAGIAATTLLPSLASAQKAHNPRRIDVHHHTEPPFLLERTRAGLLAGSPYGNDVVQWTPERSLEQMDQWGIATAMLSNPTVWSSFKDEGNSLCRQTNEYSAQLRDAHKGRFGFFGAVPLPDIDAALTEAAYVLDTLHADGIGLVTSYGDKWPGDPAFDPLFDELNRRKAVVFIHPTAPGCCGHLVPGIPAPTIEFMFDVTRCITSLLFHGAFTRFADIRFIFTHDGAALPMLADRITRNATVVKSTGIKMQEEAMALLRRQHYDVTTSTSRASLNGVRSILPVSQLLFGSDFPFLRPGDTVPGLEHYGFKPAELAAINRGNAERLFPRLQG